MALDPLSAQAQAGIADAHALLGFRAYRDPTEAIPEARAGAEQALSLDPSLAAPHVTLGWIEAFAGWDAVAAERHFRQAIALDSTYVSAHHWYGVSMAFLRGDLDLAIAELQYSVELDPLSSFVVSELGTAYARAGRHAEGVETARRAVQLLPSWVSYLQLSGTYRQAGRAREAIAPADSAVILSGRHPVSLAALSWVYMALGDTTRVRGIGDELVRQSESRYVPPSTIGFLQLWLGAEADAEVWLERAFAERDPFLVVLVSGLHWGWGGDMDVPQTEALWSRMVGQ